MADPAKDIQNLGAEYPIALLPVRIETRFVTGASAELRIRVYPDEIAADLHEPTLTAVEIVAGQAYWAEAWKPSNELDAWRRLVQHHRPARAAWIVRALEPVNLAARPDGEPEFPELGARDATFGTAITRVLPDCWLAIGYRGGAEVGRIISREIVEPLALSYRANGNAALVARDELQIEPELLWAIDFDRAVEVGMALRMPLTSNDLSLGFDRLIVLGVKTKILPDEGGARLSALLDAHKHSRGLALVRQGTPTNGSSEGASGYPPPDDPAHSFAIERQAALAVPGSDGATLAIALGVPTDVFDHVEGADRTEQQHARAMNEALWPCTLGYFLEQLMAPLLTADHIASIRGHFGEVVRGRGPCPAFRVGSVPYGLLPTTSLQHWKPRGAGVMETKLPGLLRTWRKAYLDLVPKVARVGKTGDPDADLLGILAVDASCREVRLRETLGPAYVNSILMLFGAEASIDDAARGTLVNAVLVAAGLGGTSPRIAGMTWADEALRIGRALVTSEPLSEELALSPNYIEAIRQASIEQLRAAGQPDGEDFKNGLLYHLLRQAALVEYGRIGLDVAIPHGLATELDRTEVELFGVGPGTLDRKSHWQRLAAPVPAMTGAQALGTWLLDSSTDPVRAPVRAYRASLEALEGVPTAELERLFTETLDTCSHRLDAWITSVATRQLGVMRERQPLGVHLGAFAWVENLRRQTAPRLGTAGGFIHAPSSSHAATAAILRNAHLTRTGAAREQVTIDLSSARVRNALALLDGVRQGQPAGAVLGYRFERALHDRQLDVYIAPFRRKYPLGRDPAAEPEAPGERIAARDVVDGLTLRTALTGLSPIPWQDATKLPPVAVADRTGVGACLALLDSDVDAAADLLVAESVYQVVQGNVDRASATLATLAGHGSVPTPQIVGVHRAGTSFTQRVAVVLGTPPAGGSPGWPMTTPRRIAEPRVDAWLGTLLGSAQAVRCRISYADPTAADPGHRTEATITLHDLGLAPLDVLALARRTDPGGGGGGELDARIAWHARMALGIASPVQIHYERTGAWPLAVLTFPEVLELARLIGELVAGVRPLAAADLLIPGGGGDAAPFLEPELAARASAATTQLNDVRGSLAAAITEAQAPSSPLDRLRTALWSATRFDVREAVPLRGDGEDAATRAVLLSQATTVQAELSRRSQAAQAANGGLDRLVAIFGPELPILPTFAPGNRAELDAAIAHGPALVGDVHAPRRWFEQAARVRAPLGHLRLAALSTEAVSGARLDLAIAQLPHTAGRWIGLPFDRTNPAQRPRAGTCSLALHRALGFPSGGAWAGFFVDEWAELIPADTQMTAFAVHHDAPGAEAAQCVLLAVPSPAAETWDLPSLVDTLHETLDLARIRAVDSDQLGPFALLAPCIYLAANVADDTIGLDLAVHRITETAVLAAE